MIVSRIMLLLRTKSWMEKVAGKSAHCSLHQMVMFLLITDRENRAGEIQKIHNLH